MKHEGKDVEMMVMGIVVDSRTNAPIVLLRDLEEKFCLPIWIGLPEATAIAAVLREIEMARPMTHDLIVSFARELGGKIKCIRITNLKENTFFASIEVKVGELLKEIDSRPSDAIAVALRVEAPVFVASHVYEQAKVPMASVVEGEQGDPASESGEGAGHMLRNFAEVEKEKWAELLAEMNPNDFKYKM